MSEGDKQRSALTEALARVANGDETALKAVYDLTSAKLFGICLRILNDRGDAEDALQEVYVSVWRRASRFDAARASPVTWLATIARNRAIDRLRSSSRRRPAEGVDAALDLADPAPGPDAESEADDQRRRLDGCVEELEEKTRVAIRTAFFDGLTYSALAARAEVPLGTMKSWIRRGLAKLRECLER